MGSFRQKARDAAVILAMAGPWLILLPVFVSFDQAQRFLGLPAMVVYVFGVWLLLILGTWQLRRYLTADPAAQKSDPPANGEAPADPNDPPDGGLS